MKIKKNDTVAVLSGKDRGKKGRVLQVFPERRRILVEGINYKKIHKRRSQENPKGGIVQVEGSLSISNVQLICPRCNKSTRIASTFLTDGTKQRSCKKCKEVLEK